MANPSIAANGHKAGRNALVMLMKSLGLHRVLAGFYGFKADHGFRLGHILDTGNGPVILRSHVSFPVSRFLESLKNNYFYRVHYT